MNPWSDCRCGHMGVEHAHDGPCVSDGCECGAFVFEQVVCGARETRTVGTFECVNMRPCNGGHYYRLLNTGKRGGA